MSWQPLSDRDVVARQNHQCAWCGESISIGRVCHISTGKYEGEFQSNKFHPECWKAALDVFRSGEECFEMGIYKRGTCQEKCA